MSDLKKSDFENVVEGGPYAHEVDAIRDERHRAEVTGTPLDFFKVFEEATISTGAIRVINDLNKPLEPVVGPFVENVVFHDEEENSPESGEEESESESAEKPAEDSAPERSEAEDLLTHLDLEKDLFPDEKDK
ncbi:hypothetical protein FDG92_gp12 [Arthrobacter phage Jasmine]|uniref:Uncharacterized protein n=1 Tax=Arthrobacter phage Jasmine TaxID=1772302 RepID=A0A0U4JH91_9CAUD|nr:hypothetical protein FDG92_gp12 [Arthrobacter phage Jasmine]ALY09284.1 hypothetical protein JASMINE_12 [Arthrobacter phage Jasmine]